MPRQIYVNQDTPVVQVYVKDNGEWKHPQAIYANDGGVWTQVYPDTSGSVIYTTPGTYLWQVPMGITSVTASVYAAGGGGGSGWFCGDAWTGQSGGSGGYIENQVIEVPPGTYLQIVVGAGGAGGYYGGVCSGVYRDGGRGGNSAISGWMLATGGGGGAAGIVGTFGGIGGTPNGTNGGGWNSPGCPVIPGASNGTGYGSGGNAYCAQSGANGANGAVTISWTTTT